MKKFLIFMTAISAVLADVQDPKIAEILTFWFGASSQDVPKEKMALWFGKNPATDQLIKDGYEKEVLAAANGELRDWENSPEGRLALILLLDQFPRNIYRDTPQAFTFDPLAQKLTLEGLDHGDDLKLSPIERTFFYLPLEHSENLVLQDLSVKKFNEVASAYPQTKGFVAYALRHQEIIQLFGRFPHRNKILGRESTPQEIEFLKQPNSSF